MKTPFLDLVARRRSARDYIDKPVDAQSIKLCLEAARLAPSACNSQPWRFIVVDDKRVKDELCAKAFSGIYKMNAFAKRAPAIIAVVSEKSKFAAMLGGQLRGTQYSLIDIGIACGHLALQAAQLGIGSCILGWFDEKAVKRLLKIPKDRKVDLLISVGYYRDTGKRKARLPLDEISSYNRY